jgi:hypothetical protein
MILPLRTVAIVAALGICVNSANAATITLSSSASGDATLVLVEGVFSVDDFEQFRKKVSTISKAVVAFQSDGGSVVAGIGIGRFIRLRKFVTVVGDGMRCASACALAWLGGSRRLMGADARIGFHAAYNAESGKETGVGNALVGAYLSQIGLPDRAVVYVTQAPPDSMTWLTISEAQQVGIDVDQFKFADRKLVPKQKELAVDASPNSVEAKLPEIVRLDVSKKLGRAACARRTIPVDSVLAIDLNGDHIPDYIVQFDSIPCNVSSLGHELGECGTGGCSVEVWMSVSDTWKKMELGPVRGVSAGRRLEGRNTLLVATHGRTCGQDGFRSCFYAVWWTGERFYRQRVQGRNCLNTQSSWQCENSKDRQ